MGGPGSGQSVSSLTTSVVTVHARLSIAARRPAGHTAKYEGRRPTPCP